MSAFKSTVQVLAGESDNGDKDEGSRILRRENTQCQRDRRDIQHLRTNREKMGAKSSERSRERVETEEDRAKETVPPGNPSIAGTTDHPVQRKISCMGSPTDQAPIRSPLFLENGSPDSQETRASHSNQSETTTGRQTVSTSSCRQHVAG